MVASTLATFGAGCFWAPERAFSQLEGVLDTRVGYMGGTVPNPGYDDVCTGETGHVEVVQVEFDASQISYAELLETFFSVHDPTSWDQQGSDEGSQYRSVIFAHDDEQSETALTRLEDLASQLDDDVVTEIRPAETFWVAEDDHQNFLGGRDG